MNKDDHHELNKNGVLFLPKYHSELELLEICEILGSSFDASRQYYKLPLVQILTPKDKNQSALNLYSGIFGLSIYPFHTDLAHHPTPPRYIVLRCIKGSKEVKTLTLSLSDIVKKIEVQSLRKAVVTTRKPSSEGKFFPFQILTNNIVRWDMIFLKTLNKQAEDFYKWMNGGEWKGLEKTFCLENPGDTLIVDNWKALHSRSEVTCNSLNREIHRFYLSEIKKSWK